MNLTGIQPGRIALVHANDGTDVRVGKVCRSLSAMGYDTHFIGWDRQPEWEKPVELGGSQQHVMRRPTRFGRATLGGSVAFGWHVARTLRSLRPRTVCCVNEDNALLVLPMRGVYYERLVCDVFDALVDRHSHRSWPVRAGLRAVSELTRHFADRLIATDQARYEKFGRFRDKCTVIENVPEDPGEELSATPPEGPVKVYVAGSLSLARGLRQILDVAEALPDLRIVSAGWLYDDFANNVFLKHPSVEFRGIVTARRSLELAADCDAVLSFYSPTSINNLQASPNKINDAMSVGRPVIINREVEVSEWVEKNGFGYRCPYDDASGLERIVRVLERKREELPEYARRARRTFMLRHTWSVMESRLERLYASLDQE